MSVIEHRYDAFISYNHGADGELAPAIERGLQRIAKPWYRLRALSIFRDMSDTGLNPSLWGTVEQQLDGSRWLILLACPESAASRWVRQEVTHWCDHKSVETILVVHTGGELLWDRGAARFTAGTDALAPDIAARFTSEPLWLDLRWARDQQPPPDLGDPRFKSEIARLASPIRDLPPDEIESEDLRLHRTARRLARGAVATLVTLAIVATIAAVFAVRNANRAERRAQEATARQLGLLALDLPPSELDQALLFAAAAAQLDPTDDPDRLLASRTLLGRHSRLSELLPTTFRSGGVSIQGVTIAPDGAAVAATSWPKGSEPVLLRWEAVGGDSTSEPSVETLGTTEPFVVLRRDGTVVTATDLDGADLLAADSDGQRFIVADDATRLVDPAEHVTVESWPEQATIAALTKDRAAWWSPAGLRLVGALDGETISTTASTAEPAAIAVRDDAVVTIDVDGAATWWRSSSPTLAAGEPIMVDGIGEPLAVALGSNGTRALVVGSDASALVDDESGEVTLDGVTGELSIDPTGRYAAVGGNQLTVWDLALGERVIDAADEVNAMAWSACDGSTCRLVTAGESLDAWEPASGRRIPLASQTNAQAVDISDDGDTIVSAGWGAFVAIWTLAVPVVDSAPNVLTEMGGLTAHDSATSTTARFDEGHVVVSKNENDSTTMLATIASDAPDVLALAGGATRLVVGAGGTIDMYAVDGGAPVSLPAVCRTGLWATSPAGAFLAVHRPDDGTTAVCSTDDGRQVAAAMVSGASAPARVIAVDDDGAVALGGAGHVDYISLVGLTDATTDDSDSDSDSDTDEAPPAAPATARFADGAPAIDVRFGGERAVITALAIERGRIVAGLRSLSSPAAFGRIVVWDAAAGGTPVQFETDHRSITAVAFLGTDAGLFAAAGQSAADAPMIIQLWETESRRQLGRGLGGLIGAVTALDGDETQVVGTDATGVTYRWQLDLDPTRATCDIVGRGLTDDEWDAIGDHMLERYDLRPVCDGS